MYKRLPFFGLLGVLALAGAAAATVTDDTDDSTVTGFSNVHTFASLVKPDANYTIVMGLTYPVPYKGEHQGRATPAEALPEARTLIFRGRVYNKTANGAYDLVAGTHATENLEFAQGATATKSTSVFGKPTTTVDRMQAQYKAMSNTVMYESEDVTPVCESEAEFEYMVSF